MVNVIHVGYHHGAEDVRILQKECNSLVSSMRYDVTYVTSDKNSTQGDYVIAGVKIHVIHLKWTGKKRLFKYISEVEQFICEKQFAVVHIHENVLLPLASRLASKGFKVIYDKHENTVGEISTLFNKKFGRNIGTFAGKLAARYENIIINRVDGFIIVTPKYNSMGEETNSKAVLIPNFPFISDVEELLNYDDYCANKGKLCFAGGISDTWSIARLANIIENYQGYRLILAGKGEKGYLDQLSQSNNVDYLGVLPHEMIPDLYHKSYIGVALLNSEIETINAIGTLGNTKLFEIMAAGLPVICTDSVVWRQIIDKYQCGIYVDAKDDDAVMQAIQYLCDNPEQAYLMGQNGRNAVKTEYNWEQSEGKLLALYDSICS